MNLILNNENYCVTVVNIKEFQPIKGANKIKQCSVFGYNAIVSVNYESGLYCFIPAESQISGEFVKRFNLYSDSKYNNDTSIKGYFGNSRRVRAIKLKNTISDCFIFPIAWLSTELKEGDKFNIFIDDSINLKVCNKYNPSNFVTKNNNPIKQRMPKHYSTPHFLREKDSIIFKDSRASITQKLHGTSARFANIRKQSKYKIINWFYKLFNVYEYIAGSRNQEFNDKGNNLWQRCLNDIKHKIPKDTIIYGEIIGWDNNKPIQKSYTYCIPETKYEFYVYRVVKDGKELDMYNFTDFCKRFGFNQTPIIKYCSFYDIEQVITPLINTRFQDSLPNIYSIPTEEGAVDEGVCIRVDNKIYKWKWPEFLQYETKQLDKS